MRFFRIKTIKLIFSLLLGTHLAMNIFILEIFAESAMPAITSKAAILFEMDKGQILYTFNPYDSLGAPILNKLMTCLIAVEKGKLDDMVTASKDTTNNQNSVISLEAGEKYPLEQLLKAIMLVNADSATIAVAEFIGGDTNKFVNMMNDKVKELKCKNTVFKNPTGLFDNEQYTSAYDIYIFMRHALSNPVFNHLFSQKAEPWVEKNKSKLLINPNELFWRYNGIDGGKLSFNDSDYKSCITSASRNNHRLVSIVLDSIQKDVFSDTISLLDHGFNDFKTSVLLNKDTPIRTIQIEGQDIILISPNDLYYTHPIGDYYIKQVEYKINPNLKLPIKKENSVGIVTYILADQTELDTPLYSDKDIYAPDNLYSLLIRKLRDNQDIFILLCILSIIEIIVVIYKITQYIKSKKRL